MLSVEDAEAYKAEIQRLSKLNRRLEKENAVQARTIRELEAFVDAEKAAFVEALRLATESANNPAVHNMVEDEQATTTSTDTGCTSVTDWDSDEPDVPAVMRMASSNVTVRRKKRISRNASLPDLSVAATVVKQDVPMFSSTPLAAVVNPAEASRRGKQLFADDSFVILIEDSGTPTVQDNDSNRKRYNLRDTTARSKTSQGSPRRTQA